MKNYKITVSYDGTRYKGWQVLKNEENTIQGKLQNVLSTLTGEPVEVIGSGRTDAGVHALGQVANFHLDEEKAMRKIQSLTPPLQIRNAEKTGENGLTEKDGRQTLSALQIREYLNRFLPDDIAVLSAEEVPDRFHARYNALSKTYRYRIHVSTCPDVFERRYVYTYTDFPLDIEAMKEAAGLLCGTHDYKSFCGAKHMKKSTVRTIFSIEIRPLTDPMTGELKEIDLDFTGNGFLQNMVRILAGTLIECGSRRRDPKSMPDLLGALDRKAAGYTAPACGLTLMKVVYPENASDTDKTADL